MKSAHGFADPREGARMMIERTIAAREAGLDSLFLGDHHNVSYGYYQNVPMLGRLLAEWPRTTGALFLIALWNPVLLAEQVATLASIASGRFVLQCALGADQSQFDGMGVDIASRVERFEAGLDIVRRLLAGTEVNTETPYQIRSARISPIPAEPIEVWIGGHARAAVDRAAHLGDGWIVGPDLSVERAFELIDYYLERCAHHGKEPRAIVIRRDVHVGRDQADAEAVVAPVIAKGYRGFDPAVLVYGGVGQVTERFRELGEAGFTDLLVRHIGGDEHEVLASHHRLGEVRAALV
jgi:alkanesulfonate monooxygenase SsuD/methylene tetrahydromethanopterin reductase-like flavin-dependent oxidoreductase (luciferase family)